MRHKVLRCWLVALIAIAAISAVAQVPVNPLVGASLAPMLENVTGAVVNISAVDVTRYRSIFSPQGALRRTPHDGSGLIIDAENGYVITNHHVIRTANEISVTLADKRVFPAKIIGSDRRTDIALLSIEADNLQALELADSDNLRVGDFVVAIGNPFGIGQTVTSGIVSALGRWGLDSDNFEDFIQTDASINPGNSGGPLVNLEGKVVGINTAIIGPSGGSVGIGFAIPSNMADFVVRQLIQYGEVKRGFIGVYMRSITPDLIDEHDLTSSNGVFLSHVFTGSAAAKAGLQKNDVIVSVDDVAIESSQTLRNYIGLKEPGEEVEIGLIRRGRPMTVSATLGKALEYIDGADVSPELAGLSFVDIPSTHYQYGMIEGVSISGIDESSWAYRQGLRENDVVDAVNGTRIQNLRQLQTLIDAEKPYRLRIVRGRQTAYLNLD